MEHKIKILIDHYGGHQKTAKVLKITPRHLYGIKTGKSNAGKFLAEVIKSKVAEINSKA